MQDRWLSRFHNSVNRVEPKAVESIPFKPMQGVPDRKGAHLRDAIIDGMSPRRVSVGEECRRVTMKVVTFRAKMVVDDVQENHEPVSMLFVHQHAPIIGPTIGAKRRIKQDTVITPIPTSRYIGYGHQFDCSQSGIDHVVELVDCFAKRAAGGERADVKLQDRSILPRSAAPVVHPPLEPVVVDDLARPEYILRLEVRSRIGNLQFPIDSILVKRAGARVRNRGLIPTLRLCLHRVGAIEHHLHALGARSPEAEGNSGSIELGAKARTARHGEPEKTRIDRGRACSLAPADSWTPSRGSGAVSKQAVQRLYCGSVGRVNSIVSGAALSTT